MSGYILDDLALRAGLVGSGSQHQRRELSRLLHDAVEGGPPLEIPSLCLAQVVLGQPALTDHLADIIAAAPCGAIAICGLARTDEVDLLAAYRPQPDWPVLHAAVAALAMGWPILTAQADRYARLPVDALSL
ncbi:hypothetical protein [Parafrankia sp. EUN1f]|uniref:hypothetical protein n=1 Tax=Parafrankia sp. EUN1f TaxID=102897 RepID=UPI0001C442BC|nr:hypothetical protein [Parafrankia sp. EUN1f]EFC85161.1 hypothetical protein FrEUN1fDRAFT_1790 [Parafrankia sp. EUN1f]